jgi:hypothetical protein
LLAEYAETYNEAWNESQQNLGGSLEGIDYNGTLEAFDTWPGLVMLGPATSLL